MKRLMGSIIILERSCSDCFCDVQWLSIMCRSLSLSRSRYLHPRTFPLLSSFPAFHACHPLPSAFFSVPLLPSAGLLAVGRPSRAPLPSPPSHFSFHFSIPFPVSSSASQFNVHIYAGGPHALQRRGFDVLVTRRVNLDQLWFGVGGPFGCL